MINEVDILRQLFGEVIIPEAVRWELSEKHSELPSWIHVCSVQDKGLLILVAQTLDPGESEAVVLAKELHADHLLMDERKGRRIAAKQGVPVIGLLGVILMARKRNIIPSARQIVERIDQEAGFYLSSQVKETALKTVGE